MISVVIPVLHESRRINQAIRHLRHCPEGRACEVIVVDGDPDGSTLKAVAQPDVRGIRAPRGRGIQMNAGAAAARGSILLFLHADTALPFYGLKYIRQVCRARNITGGAFDLAIDSPRRSYRFIAAAASRRSRLTRIPYGDQAIFIKRPFFLRLGGFADIPIMEDVELMRRIKNRGSRICILPAKVRTSPRRWEKDGIVRGTLRNWLLICLYLAGVAPERLKRFYR